MQTASNPFPSTNPFPRDLRSGGPNLAGAGNFYDVDPEAVANFKKIIAGQPRRIRPLLRGEKVTAVGQPRKKGATKMNQTQTAQGDGTRLTDPDAKEKLTALLEKRKAGAQESAAAPPASSGEIDPATHYPPEVIEAAKAQERVGGRRDLASVLTDDVLAVWHKWNESGISAKKIGQKLHNGLIDVTQSQVSKYLRRYRERLATQPNRTAATSPTQLIKEPKVKLVTEKAEKTAVSRPDPEPVTETTPAPKPEIEAMQTAVEPFAVEKPENLPTFFDREYRPPRPSPGDALATLAALVNDQSLRVKGSVKLNLEIEFGDSQ